MVDFDQTQDYPELLESMLQPAAEVISWKNPEAVQVQKYAKTEPKCRTQVITVEEICKKYTFRCNSASYPLADLWPIPVQLQWNGQSRTGLRPYPRSCDHEFTGLQGCVGEEKKKINTEEEEEL